MVERKAYSQAFDTGQYKRVTGLLGKYDNVRRFWEDQITAINLRPALKDLVEEKNRRLERVRVLDVGCGSGDGYDLIMGVTRKDPGIYEYIVAALTDDMLKEYVGLDINKDLLKQAEEHHGENPKMRFVRGDLSEGLPPEVTGEEPFDLYFTSYGTLSHFHDEQSARILADICKHAPDRAVFMGDWLGRYSYEWQDLWHHSVDQEYFMDYRISYIYPEEERATANAASFPLRLITRDEVMNNIVRRAAELSGVQIVPLTFFDRSVFIGRHMDTGEYNKHCPKLREPVNSLFETYVRTDLESLLVDYVPRHGFDHVNNFFELFFMSCNALVKHTTCLLSEYDSEACRLGSVPPILPFYPEPLKEAMETMRRVIEGTGWLKYGDVRANLIESVLAFCLRKLEMDLAPGTGMGHGLVGIFEIRK